jgi:hypothetical protein
MILGENPGIQKLRTDYERCPIQWPHHSTARGELIRCVAGATACSGSPCASGSYGNAGRERDTIRWVRLICAAESAHHDIETLTLKQAVSGIDITKTITITGV